MIHKIFTNFTALTLKSRFQQNEEIIHGKHYHHYLQGI